MNIIAINAIPKYSIFIKQLNQNRKDKGEVALYTSSEGEKFY